MTITGQVIRANEIGTISIPASDGSIIELQNIALAPECDSNLIFLGPLKETGISFYNNLIAITLMRDEKVIAYVRRN